MNIFKRETASCSATDISQGQGGYSQVFWFCTGVSRSRGKIFNPYDTNVISHSLYPSTVPA